MMRKLGLLIWKNLLLRKKHWIVTTLEILLPTLLTIGIVAALPSKPPPRNGGSPRSERGSEKDFIGSGPQTFSAFSESENTREDLKIQCQSRYSIPIRNCWIAYAPQNAETDAIIALLTSSGTAKARQNAAMVDADNNTTIGLDLDTTTFETDTTIETDTSIETLETDTANAQQRNPENTVEIEWIGFPSEEEIEKNATGFGDGGKLDNQGRKHMRAAIIFEDGLQSLGTGISYKIRMADRSSPYFDTSVMNSLFSSEPSQNNARRYKDSGFTAFQLNLDKALIKKLTSKELIPALTSPQEFPVPHHPTPQATTTSKPKRQYQASSSTTPCDFFPYIIVYSFIFMVPSVIKGVVNERETGIKELMILCGIPNWMHWLAWMINSMLFLTITVTIVTILFFNGILTYTDPTVFWVLLILYVLSSTAFCFFISSFFQKPAAAIAVAIILWLTTFTAVSVPLEFMRIGLAEKLSVGLLPNMALFWAFKVICGFEFEDKRIGSRWSNVFQLTCKRSGKINPVLEDQDSHPQGKPGFEAETEGRRVGVELKKLRKEFGRNHVAVAGVSVKMYDGEIFALLGHNGAGKTTAMSCCVGMMAPTSGTAIINGYDIKNQMGQVRQHLGLCPQHNLLFDELTVNQHLKFFGRLKGSISSEAAKVEREEVLRKLQLTDKTNTLAKALSGGQKRKLCLGIALIGRAKVVFLDEPTSGMDVEARRAIWNILLEERSARTIILTTHFMEEADALGDRIGIMAHGQLLCCGTSPFLKKHYGAGYTLSLTTANDKTKDDILSAVKGHVPDATYKDGGFNPGELAIIIPTEFLSTAVFPSLFKTLANNKERFGIQTIGLSLTTMDEVFVRASETVPVELVNNDLKPYEVTTPAPSIVLSTQSVTPSEKKSDRLTAKHSTNLSTSHSVKQSAILHENQSLKQSESIHENQSVKENNGNTTDWEKERLQGLKLALKQFWGLIIKRFKYSLRKWRLVFVQLIIPVCMMIVSILAGNLVIKASSPWSSSETSPPALKIRIDAYTSPVTLYSSTDKELAAAFRKTVGASATLSNTSEGLYQSLLQVGMTDPKSYEERHIVAAEMNSTSITPMFSTTPFHASPLALNLASNTLLHFLDPSKSDVTISVINHPLSRGKYDSILDALEINPPGYIIATIFGALVPVGLALLAASYIVSPVEEKLCQGKQLQLMTGVNPIIFWGSYFAWDYLVMLVVIFIMVMCFPIFEILKTYTSYGGLGTIFLILAVYGFAAIPFSYICSLFVGSVAGGFSFVAIIHIASGLVLPFAHYFMEILNFLDSAAKIRHVGRLFPTFPAAVSIMRFIEISLRNSKCNPLTDDADSFLCDPAVAVNQKYRRCCRNCHDFPNLACHEPISYITWTTSKFGFPEDSSRRAVLASIVPGIRQELLYLFLLGMAYHIVLILLECRVLQWLLGLLFKTEPTAFKNDINDDDVQEEATRVNNLVNEGKHNEDALIVENMCKSYGSFAAVSNLSFGLHHGECFGLLGVNGAGKTTTFRMLTGDEIRSNGNAFSMMRNIEHDRRNFLANMGYCPQFDGIVGVLTGREMVELFGRLRGVTSIHDECNKWLIKVGLMDSADVQCRKYSGGMKRRLSAAMAMIGDPQVVLLDEPTTGVDPVSRREFWKIISSIRASGRSIILTSHSMDEITACCSRLGIMVNGQLQCLGSVQHLKNKFAQGYSLSIRLIATVELGSEELLTLDTEILTAFSPCSIKDKTQTSLQYQIHDASFPWDELFAKMEDIKSRHETLIEEYSITETTLEEVFLAFARKQYPGREANIGLCRKIITCQCC